MIKLGEKTLGVKLIGNPGTGKTTTLVALYNYFTGNTQEDFMVEIAERTLTKMGLDPKEFYNRYAANDILFITFSTSATLELSERIYGVREYTGNIRTLHSFITKYLIDEKMMLLKFPSKGDELEDTFIRFVKDNKIPFNPEDPFVKLPANVAATMLSRVVSLYGADLKFPPKERNQRIVELVEQELEKAGFKNEQYKNEVLRIVKMYMDYKEKKDYSDYNDVLLKALHDVDDLNVSKRVIIVDEAQDLSPLQWKVLEKMAIDSHPELFIIAGDPNQAIYGFQGSDPRWFEHFPGVEVVLEQSHRVPKKVHEISKELITVINKNFKEYNPREFEGELKIFQGPTVMDFVLKKDPEKIIPIVSELVNDLKKREAVTILVRTNKQARLLEKFFTAKKFQVFGYKQTRKNDFEKIYPIFRTVKKIESGEVVSPHDVSEYYLHHTIYRTLAHDPKTIKKYELIRDYLTNDPQILHRLKGNIEYLMMKEQLKYLKEHAKDFLDFKFIAQSLGEEAAKLLKEYLTSKVKRPKIFIDTFHASKGRESDCVYIFDERSRLTAETFAEEVRTYYVAMTRAKEKLVIILTPNSFLRLVKGFDIEKFMN